MLSCSVPLQYVRYQSPVPNVRGHHAGVFALVNGLGRGGALSAAEEEFWTRTNAWFNQNLALPTDPSLAVYDRARHPLAAAWFKSSAVAFLDRVPGYLAILAAHGIPCEAAWSDDPGLMIYEDEHQVVVVPRL
jgi:hypothetical protein